MRYVKVETVLPDSLLSEIQKYVQGEYIYIPSTSEKKKKWGENTGSRTLMQKRNDDIRRKHKSGYKVDELSEEFFLSIDTIKKIIYTKG